jgi:hypothetical protein
MISKIVQICPRLSWGMSLLHIHCRCSSICHHFQPRNRLRSEQKLPISISDSWQPLEGSKKNPQLTKMYLTAQPHSTSIVQPPCAYHWLFSWGLRGKPHISVFQKAVPCSPIEHWGWIKRCLPNSTTEVVWIQSQQTELQALSAPWRCSATMLEYLE